MRTYTTPLHFTLKMNSNAKPFYPKPRPLIENPCLLEDMEKNQFLHYKASPLKTPIPKKNIKPRKSQKMIQKLLYSLIPELKISYSSLTKP